MSSPACAPGTSGWSRSGRHASRARLRSWRPRTRRGSGSGSPPTAWRPARPASGGCAAPPRGEWDWGREATDHWLHRFRELPREIGQAEIGVGTLLLACCEPPGAERSQATGHPRGPGGAVPAWPAGTGGGSAGGGAAADHLGGDGGPCGGRRRPGRPGGPRCRPSRACAGRGVAVHRARAGLAGVGSRPPAGPGAGPPKRRGRFGRQRRGVPSLEGARTDPAGASGWGLTGRVVPRPSLPARESAMSSCWPESGEPWH